MSKLTAEKILNLDIGGVLCDMHDGIPELPEGFCVESHTRWECDCGSLFLKLQTGEVYTNKLAVLVGYPKAGQLVFNYSWDGRYFGVLVISNRKVT